MKYVALLHGPHFPGAPDAIVGWVRTQGWAEAAMRLVVHVGLPAPVEAGGAPQPPTYDAVVEIWADAPVAPDAFDGGWDRAIVRASTPVIGKAPMAEVGVGVTPGLSQLSFIRAIDGMARAEVERHWDEHIPLARDIHVGMNRYVQDRLSPADPWFGMAHLHFPDEAALREGLFRNADDVALIIADVAEFVQDYATMLAVEHVVKA